MIVKGQKTESMFHAAQVDFLFLKLNYQWCEYKYKYTHGCIHLIKIGYYNIINIFIYNITDMNINIEVTFSRICQILIKLLNLKYPPLKKKSSCHYIVCFFKFHF